MSIDVVLDDFTRLIRSRAASLRTEPDEKGLRTAAATGLLFRGLELLDAARASPPAAGELLMRVAVEVSLRGRFLLTCEGGPEEFARMLGDYQKRGGQQVENLKREDPDEFTDTEFGGVAPWVVEEVPPSSAPLLDLFSVARTLDELSGLEPKNPRSALYAYRRYYQWLSNSAMHGGIRAIGRFVEHAGSGVVDPEPEGLSSPDRRWTVLMALQLLELARVVWAAHGLPADELQATGVCWDPPETAEAQSVVPEGTPCLQVALSGDLPGVLADVTSIMGDLRFVAALCERLLSMPEQNQDGFDALATRALWTAAVITYARSYARGKGYLRPRASRTKIPEEFIADLTDDEREVHEAVLVERDKHIGHRVSDLEQVIVVVFLAAPPQERQLVGVGTLMAHLAARMPDFIETLGRVATKLADRFAAEAQVIQDALMAAGGQRLDELYRSAGVTE